MTLQADTEPSLRAVRATLLDVRAVGVDPGPRLHRRGPSARPDPIVRGAR